MAEEEALAVEAMVAASVDEAQHLIGLKNVEVDLREL